MSFTALLLVLIAPLPYWALGLPWVLRGKRVVFAPMLGCAIAGFAAELAMIAAFPVKLCTAALLVLAGLFLATRFRDLPRAKSAWAEWLPWYGVSVLAASISPFPVLGSWSGDWLLIYEMGQAVANGNLPPTMLARPPLFGAAAMPLWLLHDGLVPYQLMAAVASAASVGVTLDFMRFVRPQARSVWLLPLLLSPFFLHNTAAAWSKLLAGAFVLAAVCEALRSERVWSAVLFALGIAVHEGFIIWAPFVLFCNVTDRAQSRSAVKACVYMGIAGILIVGPLIAWIAAVYGLQAKIAANPTVTDIVPMPIYMKTILGVAASFVPWGSIEALARWMSHEHPLDRSVVTKEVWWLITTWITGLAASLVGLLGPFLLVWRKFRGADWSAQVPWWRPRLTLGLAIALVLNSAIAGYYSSEGMVQAALSPLALGGFALLAACLFSGSIDERRSLRTVTWATALVGTLPWLCLNGLVTAGLVLSEGMRQRMRSGSEGDYFRVLDNHLEPLGLIGFPIIPVVALALVCAAWFLNWSRQLETSALSAAVLPVGDEVQGAATRSAS